MGLVSCINIFNLFGLILLFCFIVPIAVIRGGACLAGFLNLNIKARRGLGIC